MESDFSILSIPYFLRSSKDKSHRENVLSIGSSLATFLQQNGLVTRELIAGDGEGVAELEIFRSDLTDEGYEFYCRAEQKWLRAIDRGTPPSDTKILARELKAMRKG